MPPENAVETVPDNLFDLQLQVARRADELQQRGGEPQDRQYWLQAEQEILCGAAEKPSERSGAAAG